MSSCNASLLRVRHLLFLSALCLAGAALLPLISPVSVDAALHTCSGGEINLIGQALGAATFDGTASNCNITIRSCTADSIVFTVDVTNMVLVVQSVAASVMTAAGDFMRFAAVTGGIISIDGITGTITASAIGSYYAVRFTAAMTNVSYVHIRGVVLTTSVAAAGNTFLYTIACMGQADGDGTASTSAAAASRLGQRGRQRSATRACGCSISPAAFPALKRWRRVATLLEASP